MADQPKIPGDSLRTGHERRDINLRGLLWFTLAFITAAILIHLALGWYYSSLVKHRQNTFTAEAPVVKPRSEWPQPALQISPPEEQRQFRRREDGALRSYGWVDREHGIVHIPIERAMELTVKEAVPAPNGRASKGAPQ